MALNIPTRPYRTEAPALPKVSPNVTTLPAKVKIFALGMDSRRNSQSIWWDLRQQKIRRVLHFSQWKTDQIQA